MPDNSIYDQSAVIPFRYNGKKIDVLLITSLNGGKWIFPKGIIEKGMTSQESAAKEALEEAGVEGEVLDILVGEYRYEKWGGICHVEVYPLLVKNVLDTWPESDIRKRQWISLEEAKKIVPKGDLRTLIKRFAKQVKSRTK